MTSLVALHLRMPVECHFRKQLTEWLNYQYQKNNTVGVDGDYNNEQYRHFPHFSAAECAADLDRLDQMRNHCREVLSRGPRLALQDISVLQDYLAALLECERQGFPVSTEMKIEENALQFPWKTTETMMINNNGGEVIESSYGTLRWERANMVWNLIALEAWRADELHSQTRENDAAANSLDPTKKLKLRNGTLEHLQNAAALARYLRTEVLTNTSECIDGSGDSTPLDFGPPRARSSIVMTIDFVFTWENYLIAAAQEAAYEVFKFQSRCRPKHFMLAKFTAAAVPLLRRVEESIESMQAKYFSSATNITRQQQQHGTLPSYLQNWFEAVRAWGMWMSSLTEYHQSIAHHDRREWDLEMARLNKAIGFANYCLQFSQSTTQVSLLEDELPSQLVENQLAEMQARLQQIACDNSTTVPDAIDLPEVQPQQAVKLQMDDVVPKMLPSALARPMFSALLNATERQHLNNFETAANKILFEAISKGKRKRESGRKALAVVNLPHSLTAYKQELAGGGIPRDLWQRVEKCQKEQQLLKSKQAGWELKDLADVASTTFQQCQNILNQDVQMDELFRQQHDQFGGHDVKDVQKPFQLVLKNYEDLMAGALDSDSLLLRRCQMLETDPKFRLLQFRKSQLDLLFPPAGTINAGDNGESSDEINVAELSRHLVDLSALFDRREIILKTLQDRSLTKKDAFVEQLKRLKSENIENYSKEQLDAIYIEKVKDALARIQNDCKEMEESLSAQKNLFNQIFAANLKFMKARVTAAADASGYISGDACLVKIESALDEISMISKHLHEGKTFYNAVIPKLQKLKLEVGDISARLCQERLEFEDSRTRQSQEAADARMAASLAGNDDGRNGRPSITEQQQHYSSSRRDSRHVRESVQQVALQHHLRRSNGHRQRRPEQYDEQTNSAAMLQQPEQSRSRASNPGVEPVSHSEPNVHVDDEHMASLVAMDFDPEKVVAALKKYDNNVDHALNELLSG